MASTNSLQWRNVIVHTGTNEIELTKIIANGVVVWLKANPHTVNLPSVTWTPFKTDGEGQGYNVCTYYIPTAGSSRQYLQVNADHTIEGGAYAITSLSGKIPTEGCNRVKIEYTTRFALGGKATINNHEYNEINPGTGVYYENCTGDYYDFVMSVDAAGMDASAELRVTSISFYNEEK